MHDRYEVELRILVKSLAGRGATFMERKVKAPVKEFGVKLPLLGCRLIIESSSASPARNCSASQNIRVYMMF